MENSSEYICPYCGSTASIRHSSTVYGEHRNHGMMLVCDNFPVCDSYVGCHNNPGHDNDGLPKGTMADRRLRKWRNNAHAEFDRLWNPERGGPVMFFKDNGKPSRGKAYRWLCDTMGLEGKTAHIALFTEGQCRQLIKAVWDLRGVRGTLPPESKTDQKAQLS